tara:strand:- start:19 stop:1242 length:1224 start_codon:yes stop_codon:yes gene_type:complete
MTTPTQQTTYQVGFTPELAPYAQTLLGQAAALTDTSQNPYMQYQGERQAQFSPLQQQSFEGAQGMKSSPQLADASGIAGLASNAALNYGNYDPAKFSSYNAQSPDLNYYQMGDAERVNTLSATQPGMTEAYMSPYMSNVVARQQQDAQRQAGIASQAQGAQAARSGAFGGSGDYLMRGQAAGNLARQKGDIMAQGQQAAYQQGMQQFNAEQNARLQAQQANQQAGINVGGQNLQAKLGVQQFGAGQDLQSQLANQQQMMTAQQLGEQSRQYGAGLGLQGLQTAMTGANALGSLGNTQYQQNMGINQLQNQYGLQQQQQMQGDINNKYQDFLNYQNYPYKQLGFMSDIVRGVPLTQTGSSLYQAPPSTMQNITSLGLAGAGISKLMANGGVAMSNGGGLGALALNNLV